MTPPGAIVTVYSFTLSDLEETGDVIKVAVLRALVSDGLLAEAVADEWAGRHTIKVSKKTIWRTLSTLWEKTAEVGGMYYTVLGHPPIRPASPTRPQEPAP